MVRTPSTTPSTNTGRPIEERCQNPSLPPVHGGTVRSTPVRCRTCTIPESKAPKVTSSANGPTYQQVASGRSAPSSSGADATDTSASPDSPPLRLYRAAAKSSLSPIVRQTSDTREDSSGDRTMTELTEARTDNARRLIISRWMSESPATSEVVVLPLIAT